MIDYSEGCHELKVLVNDLYEACISNRYTDAKALCDKIVVVARITRAQIGVQAEKS